MSERTEHRTSRRRPITARDGRSPAAAVALLVVVTAVVGAVSYVALSAAQSDHAPNVSSSSSRTTCSSPGSHACGTDEAAPAAVRLGSVGPPA
jgi:hypothetical protein